MNDIVAGFERVEYYLRVGLFWVAVILAALCAVDWLVRTRRINPFGPIARFFRHAVDPLIVPVERRVIRAGGTPTSAPWWALVFVVVGGIVLLALVDYMRGMLAQLAVASSGTAGGLARLLIQWTFLLLQFALIVRVISSWVQIPSYSRWVHWSFTLTEWILRPLRRVIPPLGMFDLSPLIAWVLLSWVVEPLVLSLLARPM